MTPLNCTFADPEEIASFILTHMQNDSYDARMSSFYSKYLVQALVQASVEAGRARPRNPNAKSSGTKMTLEQFRTMASAQEQRVVAMIGKKTVPPSELPV